MDKYLIDTSSLLSLVRYYHPFDRDRKLYTAIKKMFETKQFLLLGNVYKEAKYIAQQTIVTEYDFLKKIKLIKSIDTISEKLHRKIDNDWIILKQKKSLEQKKLLKQIEYEETKQKEFQNGADWQLICMAMNNQGFTIVTEETKQPNDAKLFKKIPLICEHEKIPCITLPVMLKKIGIGIEYKKKQAPLANFLLEKTPRNQENSQNLLEIT